LGPQATLGPGSIVRDRDLYNEVINYTNSEQTLGMIVRTRHGDPSGLLSVVSVTANLRASATTDAQFGIGASQNFAGNLVPLAAGLAYEENPTISPTGAVTSSCRCGSLSGAARPPRLNVQTRSVYDLLQIAAAAVEVPAEHVERGLVDPGLDGFSPPEDFLTVRSSRKRSATAVLAEVQHRGWWFYIPTNDGASKFGFALLQGLMNMRLMEGAPQTSPTLTIPVGK
jgi:hypothetical protein